MLKDHKPMTRRDFLKGASFAVASGVLAGCVSARETAPIAGPTTVGKPQYKLDLGGYTGPAPTTQNIQLRVLRQVYPPYADEWWQEMYAQWTAVYPNITFQEETVPYGDLQQKIQTYVAAGDAPDIMMGKGDFVQAYAYHGIALNLNDFLSQDYLDDLAPAMRAAQMVNGDLYAWPWEQGNTLFYFNKEMFEQANVAMPPETDDLSQAWTWSQVAEAWGQLKEALNPSGEITIFPLAASKYGNGGPGSSYFYEGIYIRSMGDPEAPVDSSLYKTFAGVSPDGLSVSGYVDSPEAIEGMRFYQSIFQQKFSPPVAVSDQFEKQQAAIRFASLSFVKTYQDPNTGLKFRWGASPIPRGRIVFNHTTGDAPIVSAKTKYPAEAVAFTAFLHNDTNRVAWHRTWGNLPARLSLFEMMPEYKEFPKSLGAALSKAGYAPPVTPGYLEYFNAMNTAVKDIGLGAPVEDRLHRVAEEIDDSLAQYKS